MNGASTASTMNSSTTAAPTIAPRRCNRRRSARRQGESSPEPTRDKAVVSASVVILWPCRGPGSMGNSISSCSEPRIDEEIGDVGEQIEQDIGRCRHQHDALHYGVVAIEHRIDDQLTEAGN